MLLNNLSYLRKHIVIFVDYPKTKYVHNVVLCSKSLST